MINKYAIGFVFAAAVIVAGVDYYDQTKKAGLSLGQMSLSAYANTVPNRINAAKAAKQAETAERERKSRWRQGGKPYLPEAPEGWTRRALLEGDDTPILPPEAKKFSESAGQTLLEQMEAREHVKQQKERAARSWIYQRGTETVFVEVQLVERPNTSSLFGVVASAMDGEMLGSFDKNVGYGVIGGFGLTERLKHDGTRPYHFRFLEGAIGFGDEVHLKVHANASREATYEILSRIDYDGLNNLLPEPMSTVGNAATPPEGMDPVALSMELRRLKTEFLSLRALEAQYKINNIDTGALLMNVYAARLGSFDNEIDITGGKVTDLSALVKHGYYTGVEAVMAGKSAEEVQAEVKKMIDTAMMVVDAETAAAAARAANAPEPEMSPELKAELAYLETNAGKPGSVQKASLEQGNPILELDVAATRAAGYRPISMAGDALRLKAFAGSLQASEKEIVQSFKLEVFEFASKFGVPARHCAFVPNLARIECSVPMSDAAKAKIAAKNRARDMDNSDAGKVVMQIDEEASNAAEGKTYSKAIDLVAFEAFKDARSATDAEMKLSMMIAAKGFEKKHGLATGSCEFSLTRLRIECESEQGDGGDIAAKPEAAAVGEKPKRLELNNGGTNSKSRCVGSFCD